MLGSGSIHASPIRGGQEWSSYPEQCWLAVERRTVPGETLAEAEAQIRSVLSGVMQRDARASLMLRTGLSREPFEAPAGAAIVALLRSEIAAARGAEPRTYGDTPWMDSALTAAAGIPTVVFGPGGGGAHAVVEWSNLDEVELAAKILARVARRYCC